MGQTDMFEPAALNIGSSSLKAQPTPTANSAGTIMLDCLDDAKSLDTEFLDDLVIEFLKPMPQVVIEAESIKEDVEKGNIEAAIVKAEECCPTIFEDQRLFFRLKQQQFVEYLRDGSQEGQKNAIDLLRNELNPLALDSYHEAYAELKQCLLTLVISEKQQHESMAKLWSLGRRSILAGRLARTIRQHHGHCGSRLGLIVVYLKMVLICYAKACLDAQQGDKEEAEDWNQAIRQFREAPPTTPENFSLEDSVMDAVSNVKSVYIVSLKHLLQLSRDEVVDSLKVAGGSLEAALKNELAALPFTDPLLTGYVSQYALERGLISSKGSACELKDADQREASCRAERTGRYGRNSSLSPPKKMARHCPIDSASPSVPIGEQPCPSGRPEASWWRASSFQRLRSTVESGELDEALAELGKKAPGFLTDNPCIHFELLTAKFQQLLDKGRTREALHLVQSKLTPITLQDSTLQPNLTAVVSRLVPGSGSEDRISPTSLSNILEKELRSWLGLAEPDLVLMLQALLSRHEKFFEREGCADCLAPLLGIDKLQPEGLGPGGPSMQCAIPTPAASCVKDAANADETTRLEDIALSFDEELISDTMDITHLSRPEVIQMLRDFDGDRDMLLEHHFMLSD